MGTLRIEIDTDASYTAEELEGLEEAFLEFILPIDGDVRQGTENVRLIDGTSESDSTEDEKIEAKAIELLKSGKFTFSVDMSKGGTANLEGFMFPGFEL